MAVDLHLHSTYSDGTDTPDRIVRAAADLDLSTIALTDHDNLDGIESARAAADSAGIDLISGTEISVSWQGEAMHLLVYFLEPGPGPLQGRLGEVQQGRTRRNKRIVGRLNEAGIEITYAEVVAEAGGTGIGRPHFAAVMMDKGYVATIAEAFDRYLATDRPGYVARVRLDAVEAIGLARRSGAVPVIAHPHTLGVAAADYRRAFETLTAAGLGGIECYYPEYATDVRDHLAEVCEALGIAATGGSDYHGAYKPDLSIGVGRGDLHVPEKAVEDLAKQRESIT